MSQVKDRLLELKQVNVEVIHIDDEVATETDTPKKQSKKKRDVRQDVDKTLEKAEEIRALIQNIEDNLQKIAQLDEEAKNGVFKVSNIFREINAKFKENADVAYKIANKLKELNAQNKKIKDDQNATSRIQIIQFSTLKDQFSEVLHRNNDLLEKHKSIEKENLKIQIKVVDANYDDEQLEELLQDSNNPFQVFTDNHLISTEEAKRQLADIEERHQVLLQLEERLVEVRDLFRQIAILVDMQQESINRIEHHAGAATEFIEAVDLNKVRKRKNRYLKRKCYIILAAVILVTILVIAIIY